MKSIKVLAAMVLALGATSFATAQTTTTTTTTSKPMRFGIKGGVNFATVTGDDFDSPDSRTNFHVGLVGEFPISEMFSIQPEVVYSGQGFKSDFDGAGGDKIEYQLDYINVPVLAKIYIVPAFSIEVGPQFGFKVNEQIDTDPSSGGGGNDINEAKSFDFALAGGVTFQTDGFFVYGRYNYGLTDVIEDADVHNSVFQLGVGFKF